MLTTFLKKQKRNEPKHNYQFRDEDGRRVPWTSGRSVVVARKIDRMRLTTTKIHRQADLQVRPQSQ